MRSSPRPPPIVSPLPWPPAPPPRELRDRPDGPRSLPTTRLTSRPPPDSPSYSSLARLATDDSSILPDAPPVSSRHRTREKLIRSDSLLNKARRVFSLPTSLKRRGLVETAKKEVKEDQSEQEGEDRVRWLEDEVAGLRQRAAKLKTRVNVLEKEMKRERESRPKMEMLIRATRRHFEAKERALKHTIERMDHEYAAVVAEKNEAMRLLTAFVGRGGRSPPASFSSVSEGGSEAGSGGRVAGEYKARGRAMSLDALRRGNVSRNVGGRSLSSGVANDEGHEGATAV